MNPSCSISVIVPVYNPGCHFAACLDSMLAQTVQDWELILVDDGSPDGSGAVCDEYAAKDPRIRVIHTPNRGPGAARNTGIDAVRAPFFTFADADDTVDPDFLEILLSAGADPDILAVTGLIQHFEDKEDDTTFHIPQTVSLPDFTKVDPGLPILHYASPCTKRFDTALVRREGMRFPTEFSIQEDLVFYLDYLLHAKRIALIKGMPYHYYHRAGDSSLVHRERSPEEFLAAGVAVSDKLMQIRETFPAYGEKEFSRALSKLGLMNFIRALRASRDKVSYKKALAEVRKRRRLFFKYFHHGRGFLRNWFTLLLAAAGIGPLHKNKRYSYLGEIRP